MSDAPQTAAEGAAADFRLVDERVDILRLLDEFVRERAQLAAFPDGVGDVFGTAIVEIRERDDALLLDELVPAAGNAAMAASRSLWLVGQLHGIKTAFRSDIRESGARDGAACHLIGLPRSMRRRQRRDSYRAVVPWATESLVHIECEDGAVLNGRLSDLSLGGLAVRLSLRAGLDLPQPGTLLPHCRIELPSQERLEALVEVRYARTDANGRNALLGLSFRGLDARDQRLLQRSVNLLQRQRLRKNARPPERD